MRNALLLVAYALVVAGACLIAVPAGLIVAGLLGGALILLSE